MSCCVFPFPCLPMPLHLVVLKTRTRRIEHRVMEKVGFAPQTPRDAVIEGAEGRHGTGRRMHRRFEAFRPPRVKQAR